MPEYVSLYNSLGGTSREPEEKPVNKSKESSSTKYCSLQNSCFRELSSPRRRNHTGVELIRHKYQHLYCQ